MERNDSKSRRYQQVHFIHDYEVGFREQEGDASTLPIEQPRARFDGSGDSESHEQSRSALRHSPANMPLARNLAYVSSYGYAQGLQSQTAHIPASSLQYYSEFSQASQSHQRQQPVSNDPYRIAYNVSQPAQSGPPFEIGAQYHPQQINAVEGLSNRFGGPSHSTAGEEVTSFRPPISPQQFAAASFRQTLPFNPPPDVEQSGLMSLNTNIDTSTSQSPSTEAQSQRYEELDRFLRKANDSTSRGKLAEALISLRELTSRTLTNVDALGLTKDDERLYNQRLGFWNNFNLCWLAFLTRQEKNTRHKQASILPEGEDVLPMASLELLGDELTQLLDPLETRGLIDYSIGVSEEEIITMLLKCEGLLQAGEEKAVSSSEASRAHVVVTSSPLQD